VQAAGALLSGSISLITWKYVKEANRVAAEALRQGIEKERAARDFERTIPRLSKAGCPSD
jgi:hypothetical protein